MACIIVHINHAEEAQSLLMNTCRRSMMKLFPRQPDCTVEYDIGLDFFSNYEDIKQELLYACIPFSIEKLNDNQEIYEGVDYRYDENGELRICTRCATDPLDILMELNKVSCNPNLVVQNIQLMIEKYTPLPWTNQDHYAKIHKLKNLVNQ